jgi:hypothetical protein
MSTQPDPYLIQIQYENYRPSVNLKQKKVKKIKETDKEKAIRIRVSNAFELNGRTYFVDELTNIQAVYRKEKLDDKYINTLCIDEMIVLCFRNINLINNSRVVDVSTPNHVPVNK